MHRLAPHRLPHEKFEQQDQRDRDHQHQEVLQRDVLAEDADIVLRAEQDVREGHRLGAEPFGRDPLQEDAEAQGGHHPAHAAGALQRRPHRVAFDGTVTQARLRQHDLRGIVGQGDFALGNGHKPKPVKSNGYGTSAKPWPIVTGQDAEEASVKSILRGEQYSTIYKDTRQLAKTTVAMADAVLKGGQPTVNNTTDYNNGVKVVPSMLLQSVIVDKSNYKKELVDSGYYTQAQLGS